ncbi:MAG: YCII-related protein [Solirubrobacterales bacterium]|nr:YCII-related protein [Solirubrobacterales bacterium]
MEYAALIYERSGYNADFSEEERRAITGEYMEISRHPSCRGGGALQSIDTATTVRVDDGEALVTDGPFANTKEVFAGYFVFEADNLDPVLEIAGKIPAARFGGAVEVRPLMELPR